jgi:catechol 2,3-dioxygenase-like lactoylglutathione lyase family enzyme
MPVQLDHFIVPSHNRIASAKMLADLLGVPWSETAFGIFSPVYLNDGLTLDFVQTDEDYPVHHYCFRVPPDEFDAILARIRAAGIDYRSTVRGPVDFAVDTRFGDKGIYWNEPDGHQWEMLTASHARQPR